MVFGQIKQNQKCPVLPVWNKITETYEAPKTPYWKSESLSTIRRYCFNEIMSWHTWRWLMSLVRELTQPPAGCSGWSQWRNMVKSETNELCSCCRLSFHVNMKCLTVAAAEYKHISPPSQSLFIKRLITKMKTSKKRFCRNWFFVKCGELSLCSDTRKSAFLAEAAILWW